MLDLILSGTEIRATRLGFGCGRLMRLPKHSERKNVIAAALENGIKYFDVAPMYGMGTAEAELARCLGSRRHEVTISTKFGIESRRGALNAGFFQVTARTVLKAVPTLKKIVKRHAHVLYKARRYDVEAAKGSLLSSMRDLGVERLGVLLLHEPLPSELNDPDLLPWLESARSEGIIGGWGIAGESTRTAEVASRFPQLAQVWQFDNDALHRQIERMPASDGRAFITFSPLLDVHGLIWSRFSSETAVAKRWSNLLGYDFSLSDTIARFLIAYALRVNPNGVVLYSTGSPERIRQVARWAEDSEPGQEAIDIFLKLLAEIFPPPRK